ncbi:MAG TPA: pilus assembly protein TadG-related protein [Caulobacteraceae bacterium]|nr:pilus assembly protein TadG-related protein [Caulobacteraceae bacterium]
MRSLIRRIAALFRDRRGGTAVIFGLAAPVLGVIVCAAIDLAQVGADNSAMQDAADATALAMAKQLGVATAVGIGARAQAFADRELGPIAAADAVRVGVLVASDNSSVTVRLAGHRSSFFGDLLPAGGWRLHARATAASLGELPLCVLSYGAAGGYNLDLTGQARLTAANCLVQSNGDITAAPGAALQAGMAQASGVATGPITPAAQTGAPAIADPFASMNVSLPPLGLCNPLDLLFTAGVNVLAPGVHCGNITVRNGAVVELLPGEHYFEKGQLRLQQNSQLVGSDVVLVFDESSQFHFDDTSVVTLSGRTSGPYAGFVIATTRANTGVFGISSTSARKLEGTIYIPSATLSVQGAVNTVADQSAWTVVVAQSIRMGGSANLVINSAYATSSVPVPAGVGASFANSKVRLER